MVVLASLARPSTLGSLANQTGVPMKKIIVLAACVLLTSSAYAADEKSKMTVAKAEVKAVVSATSKAAPRAMKASATESTVYDYNLERDGCCFTR
jgi:hypothetical protein